MSPCTRRAFLRWSGAAVAASAMAAWPREARANALGLPLGLQLFAIREMLAADYAGALKHVAALGFQEVESAGFFGHTPEQVSAAMKDAGLRLVSAHFGAAALEKDLAGSIAVCQAVGSQYIICSFPAFRDPAKARLPYLAQMAALTLNDYRWSADRFNAWGRQIKAAGLQFGYHNNAMEFPPQNGVVPYDELLRLTDPKLVTLEMDCGWVTAGGGDPVAYLERYPERITLLHVKDFRPAVKPVTPETPPPPAEMGRGTYDFARLFRAARKAGHVRHCFVEQEGFDLPPWESLEIDAKFMQQQS